MRFIFLSINLAFHQEGTFVPVTYVLTFDGRKVLFLVHILLVGQHYIYVRGCQICMQGPQLCAKLRHFCKLDVATSRMAFLYLNLHALQLDNSISNNCNWGYSVVQNCTSDTPYWGYLKFMTPFPGITKSIWLSKYGRYAVCTLHNTFL